MLRYFVNIAIGNRNISQTILGGLACVQLEPFYLLVLFLKILIYLFRLGRVLVAACGIWFPDQRLNLGPLHWERGVLPTGPPGKSPVGTLLE